MIKPLRKLIWRILLLLRAEALTRQPILRLLVWLHNWSYHLISLFASHDGTHPKHAIMRYHEFFLAHITPTDHVLDVGSGSGKVAYEIAAKAAQVQGIDLRSANVIRAQTTYQRDNLSFVEGDATTHSFSEPVDVIVLSNVLEHIDDRVGLLQKLSRIAPKILIRVPMLTRDWLTVYKKEAGFEYRLDDTHFIEYTTQAFAAEAAAAGLTIEHQEINFVELYAVWRAS